MDSEFDGILNSLNAISDESHSNAVYEILFGLTCLASSSDELYFMELLEQLIKIFRCFSINRSTVDEKNKMLQHLLRKLLDSSKKPRKVRDSTRVAHKAVATTDSLQTIGQKVIEQQKSKITELDLQNSQQNSKSLKNESKILATPSCLPPPPPPPSSLLSKITNAFCCKTTKSKVQKEDSTAIAVDQTKILKFDLPKPSQKMKPLVWSPLPIFSIAPKSSQCNKEMKIFRENIWTPVDSFDFSLLKNFRLDFAVLDELFSQKPFQNSRTRSSNSSVSKECCSSRRRSSNFLDHKRSLSVNIFLTSFKGRSQEVLKLLACGEGGTIGIDRLESLLKLLPENKEVEVLRNAANDNVTLEEAESFILSLGSLEHIKMKIEALLLKEDFDSAFIQLKSCVETFMVASNEILTSHRLRGIMHVLLLIGNYLNSGSNNNKFVSGFKLDSLSCLTELKANKPNSSVVHYLIAEIEKLDLSLLDFVHDLSHIEDAVSKDSLETLTSSFQTLQSKVLRLSRQSLVDDINFETQIKIFLNYANRSLASLESDLSAAKQRHVQLAEYFCEDPSMFKCEECFKILRNFKRKFSKAIADLELTRTRELKRMEKHRSLCESDQSKHAAFDTLSIGSCDTQFSYVSPIMLRKKSNHLQSQNFTVVDESKFEDNTCQPSFYIDFCPSNSYKMRNSEATMSDDTKTPDFGNTVDSGIVSLSNYSAEVAESSKNLSPCKDSNQYNYSSTKKSNYKRRSNSTVLYNNGRERIASHEYSMYNGFFNGSQNSLNSLFSCEKSKMGPKNNTVFTNQISDCNESLEEFLKKIQITTSGGGGGVELPRKSRRTFDGIDHLNCSTRSYVGMQSVDEIHLDNKSCTVSKDMNNAQRDVLEMTNGSQKSYSSSVASRDDGFETSSARSTEDRCAVVVPVDGRLLSFDDNAVKRRHNINESMLSEETVNDVNQTLDPPLIVFTETRGGGVDKSSDINDSTLKLATPASTSSIGRMKKLTNTCRSQTTGNANRLINNRQKIVDLNQTALSTRIPSTRTTLISQKSKGPANVVQQPLSKNRYTKNPVCFRTIAAVNGKPKIQDHPHQSMPKLELECIRRPSKAVKSIVESKICNRSSESVGRSTTVNSPHTTILTNRIAALKCSDKKFERLKSPVKVIGHLKRDQCQRSSKTVTNTSNGKKAEIVVTSKPWK